MLGSYFKDRGSILIRKTGFLQPASGSVKTIVCMNGFDYTGFSQAQTYLDHRILGPTHMKQIQEACGERKLQSSSHALAGLAPLLPVALADQVPRKYE